MDAGQTKDFPTVLPMENNYGLPKYFVRPCYPVYYALILTLVEKFDIVTVTGTPGTGKSVFYGYFFERYKSEVAAKKKTTIITASFTHGSIMKKAVVFRDDDKVESFRGEAYIPIGQAHDDALGRESDMVYLYDGPPRYEPERPSKMVCFSSPNEHWLNMASKKPKATKLYMPLWDVEELVAAVTSLRPDLLVPRNVAENRFAIFGGVARCCLAVNEEFVKDRIAELENDINGIDVLPMLKRLASNIEGGPTYHRMCHYRPKPDNPKLYDVQLASEFVSLRVLETIASRNFEYQDEVFFYLRRVSTGAALRGHFLE